MNAEYYKNDIESRAFPRNPREFIVIDNEENWIKGGIFNSKREYI